MPGIFDFSNFGLSTLFFITGYFLFYVLFKDKKSHSFWNDYSEVERFIFGTACFAAFYFSSIFIINIVGIIGNFSGFAYFNFLPSNLLDFHSAAFIFGFGFIGFLIINRRMVFKNTSYADLSKRQKITLSYEYCSMIIFTGIIFLSSFVFTEFAVYYGYNQFLNGLCSYIFSFFTIVYFSLFITMYIPFKINKIVLRILDKNKRKIAFVYVGVIIASSAICLYSFPHDRYQESLVDVSFAPIYSPEITNASIIETIQKLHIINTKVIKWLPTEDGLCVSYDSQTNCTIINGFNIVFSNSSSFNFTTTKEKKEVLNNISGSYYNEQYANKIINRLQIINNFNITARSSRLLLTNIPNCSIIKQEFYCSNKYLSVRSELYSIEYRSYQFMNTTSINNTTVGIECDYTVSDDHFLWIDSLHIYQNSNFTLISEIKC